MNQNKKIAVLGLGYVGLPLAAEFGKVFETIGFDIDNTRIEELQKSLDVTQEVTESELEAAVYLSYSSRIEELKSCNIYIITVPTPIDEMKNPDLAPLIRATEMVGEILKHQDIVIYESTVYPGATEEVCVPVLEKTSGLVFNDGFFCGYSPERINPGDKSHRIRDIKKVTSGSTEFIADEIDALYQTIILAGTYKAESIKIAEASKVIENTQRDVNIALINEFSMIFNKLNIDTQAVLEAAGTKWNFLPFKPGLVGGHCIGVDPYYLTHKAMMVGHKPEIMLSGRSLNDGMAAYVVGQVRCLMTQSGIPLIGSNLLIMGLTFKENCPDLRNSRVFDLIREFEDLGSSVDVCDPWVDSLAVPTDMNFTVLEETDAGKYDAIIIAVAHDYFRALSIDKIRVLGKENHIVYDLKYVFSADEVDGRL